MTTLAFLLWPDTFEDWYHPLGLSRAAYLDGYDREWSISLAEALVRGGIDVHVYFFTLREEQTAVQHPSGATVHFVRAPVGYRALRQVVWRHRYWQRMQPIWAAAPVVSTLSTRLLRSLRRLRPDAVVVQDYESLRYDAAAPLLRLAGLRVMGLDTGGSARPSQAPWKRWTRELATQLLAVHEKEASRLRSARHTRVQVWPVPVRTDVFVPGERGAARAELRIDPDERLVFSASRLHAVKNLPMLVDACTEADATLVLTGDGPERERLEGYVSERVKLIGWQPLERMVQWYAAADVVALSSIQEGQPIAVLEAFACGRGVVATAVGGVPEVVRNGETGWLVRPRDHDALAAALDKALADRETSDRYGMTGRDLVLRRHSADAVARFLADVATHARPNSPTRS